MNVAYKQNTIQLYTLEDAEKLIDYRRAKEYRRKKFCQSVKKFTYFLLQKLCGLAFIAIGIIIPAVCDKDVTISILVIPLGLYLLITRKRIMTFMS